MTQAVCVTRAAVCWCLKATSIHTNSFQSFSLSSWVVAFDGHILFSRWLIMFSAIVEAVCGCLKDTSLQKIPFSNFNLWGWLLVVVCHVLFSQCFKLYVSLWISSAGAWELPVYTHCQFQISCYDAGRLFVFVMHCFLYDSTRLCHSGSFLLVVNNYNFTQHPMPKCHFITLDACLCLPLIVFCLTQCVFAILEAVCWR